MCARVVICHTVGTIKNQPATKSISMGVFSSDEKDMRETKTAPAKYLLTRFRGTSRGQQRDTTQTHISPYVAIVKKSRDNVGLVSCACLLRRTQARMLEIRIRREVEGQNDETVHATPTPAYQNHSTKNSINGGGRSDHPSPCNPGCSDGQPSRRCRSSRKPEHRR